jgi:hypothetical protein
MTARRVHWPRRVRVSPAVESIDLLCGFQDRPGLTTHDLNQVTCARCRVRLRDRRTLLVAITEATQAERQAQGLCRHCGGPVSCGSAFGDVVVVGLRRP